jgi:hypothetical protein
LRGQNYFCPIDATTASAARKSYVELRSVLVDLISVLKKRPASSLYQEISTKLRNVQPGAVKWRLPKEVRAQYLFREIAKAIFKPPHRCPVSIGANKKAVLMLGIR